MDNAVSPFASLVIIFDVTPPGQDANILIPTAISFVIPASEIIIKAIRGSIAIWLVIPTKNDMIFLHGPMVNPAAGYEVQGTISGKKSPRYSLKTYNF